MKSLVTENRRETEEAFARFEASAEESSRVFNSHVDHVSEVTARLEAEHDAMKEDALQYLTTDLIRDTPTGTAEPS